MRALNWDFCAVCRRVIRNKLSPFLPRPDIPDLSDLLDYLRQKFKGDWVSDPVLSDILRSIGAPDELSRLMGTMDQMDPAELRMTLLRLRAGIARLETAARLIEGKLGT
jgi:hypothetical protein